MNVKLCALFKPDDPSWKLSGELMLMSGPGGKEREERCRRLKSFFFFVRLLEGSCWLHKQILINVLCKIWNHLTNKTTNRSFL